MDPEDIKAVLQEALIGCDIEVAGDGRHYDLRVIGDIFEGERTIKRQQRVYAVLNPLIASGGIHAVNMQLFTPAEWASR